MAEKQKNPNAVALGHLGGVAASKSEKQKEAARRNGKLGGRPRTKVRDDGGTRGKARGGDFER